jgi:hypothetical protein
MDVLLYSYDPKLAILKDNGCSITYETKEVGYEIMRVSFIQPITDRVFYGISTLFFIGLVVWITRKYL